MLWIQDKEILANAGYRGVETVETEGEIDNLTQVPPPWRIRGADVDDDGDADRKPILTQQPLPKRLKFSFKTKFDVEQFDIDGTAIDKGDDKFIPSRRFKGGKKGFEFKLGVRGQGYYLTENKLAFGL